jgi:hypothetical protein
MEYCQEKKTFPQLLTVVLSLYINIKILNISNKLSENITNTVK